MESSLVTLEKSLLTGKDVRMEFDRNWLQIFDKTHADVPVNYKIDFLHKAQLAGADPRRSQIYLTTYFSKKLGHKVGVPVFSYHFFINQANQTGQYKGVNVVTEVKDIFNPITGEQKKQLVATATAHRLGCAPVTFEAIWAEFFNANNDMWNKIPYTMLKKCAIAGALRWAFPEALSGMFISEEVGGSFVEEVESMQISKSQEQFAENMIKASDEMSEKAKNATRKEPLIEAITAMCSEITKGFTKEQKLQFMKDRLKVDSFARLKANKLEELKDIADSLTKLRSSPVVMPDENNGPVFTQDDIPWN
jgi:phage recombination protein Bet